MPIHPQASKPWGFLGMGNKKSAADKYVSKKQLVQDALRKILRMISCDEVLVDGEFSSKDMLKFFAEEGIEFTARIARNRIAETDDGTKTQLQLNKAFRLTKNRKSKTAGALIDGGRYQITAVKSNSKHAKHNVVFIISTKKRAPKEHVKTYKTRWVIEKFFRTTKQSLGLEDCQAHSIDAIKQHIIAALSMFTALEETKFVKKQKSVEAVLAIAKSKNRGLLSSQYIDLIESFMKC